MRRKASVCPNPKCHKKFGKPILLNNLSTTPATHCYVCPYCFIKLRGQIKERKNLVGFFLSALGFIVLATVACITIQEMVSWHSDIFLIFFSSRPGEAVSLGIGLKIVHYFLIGLVFLPWFGCISSKTKKSFRITFQRSRTRRVSARFTETASFP